MTGFGLKSVSTKGWLIEVSIKSVNGRFFDTRFRLPKEFIKYENDLKKRLQKKNHRGSFEIYVSRKLKSEGLVTQVSPDVELSKNWLKAYRKLAQTLKIEDDLTMSRFLKAVPQSFKFVETQKMEVAEKRDLLKAFSQAILVLEKEKTREGLALKQELERLINDLKNQVNKIEKLRVKTNKGLKEKLTQKLKQFDKKVQISDERIYQELLLQIDRSDIDEEVTRLKEHLRSLKPLLNAKGPLGKKLDFYSQELLREMNTIGSKSQMAELTAVVVDAKSIIERLREQVQNIE